VNTAVDNPPFVLPGRVILLLGLFALEAYCAVHFFTNPPAFNDPAIDWGPLLSSRQFIFGPPLFGGLVWLAITHQRLPQHLLAWSQAATRHSLALPLALQLLACAACYALAWPLYYRPMSLGPWAWPLIGAWASAVLACGALTLWTLAPIRFWATLARVEHRTLVVAGIGAALGGALLMQLFRAWGPEAILTRLTLGWSAALLRQVYPDAHADPATAILGTSEFSVLINSQCSGYLGVGLTLCLLACYFYTFRAEIKPWVMLVLAPVAVALSLFLNVVRIVILVTLGVEISPEVAINGFHTHAGSIAMVLTCTLIVSVVHWGLVARPGADAEAVPRVGWRLDYESALLIPMLVLLAATLVTGAFSGTFVWLYPLRVAAVAVALLLCWPYLRDVLTRPSLAPVLIGVAVFVLWLALVPGDAEADAAFAATLDATPSGLAGFWLVARVLGAVITVPIAEELAFRGYLLTALSRRPVVAGAVVPFHWVGFAGSSLLFGILHGQWLAGTVAGAAYAWARYRRGCLGDAVLAHMTTNLLLAVYVFATGQWSYW
jgi:exosortase E/protease (VPEID-CTERM system)